MTDHYVVTVQMAHLAGDRFGYQPCLLVDQGGERVGRVFVILTGTAAHIASHNLNGGESHLESLLMRYGVNRLATQLSRFGGADELFGPNETQEWVIDGDHLNSELLAPILQEKSCGYQTHEGRDYFCLAADKGDETVVGTVGSRLAAPTSPSICASCALPDERTLCSHLSHPLVTAIRTIGAPPSRFLGLALCNQGSDLVKNPSACQAGGNHCWQLIVEVPSPPPLQTASPLSLPEALDFLDAVWRLAAHGRLIRPSTFADTAGLVGDCETAEEFESRLSDIADAIDRIQVDQKLLPTESEIQGGLNQFKYVLSTLQDVDVGVVDTSLQTLQRIRGLRHTHQHSGQSFDRPRILRELGIPDNGLSWAQTLAQVRSRAVQSLLALRSEIRRTIKDDE